MGKSKKVSTVTMVNDPTANPATKLTKGHYRCDCQARSHALIHNCLNCGRIVCAQEGSGPCFFCGELVVSREEREILENGSNTQRKKLMMALTGKSGDASLSTMSTDFQRAQTFRDNLLRADADMERQKKVDDLDSDYHNIEQSSHLTAEERAAIIKRKEELVELDKARQRQVIVSISAEGEVTEQKQARVTAETDPIIRAIVQNSLNRKQTVTTANARRKPVDESFNAKDFTPFYNKEYSRNVDKEANCRNRELLNREDILLQANEEMLHHEIEKEGYCIAFDQPFATVALTENIEYLPWHEETSVRGPVFVAASTRIPNDKEIEHVKKIYGLKSIPKAGDLSIGAILGRLIIDQCWKTEDFIDELGGNSRKSEKKINLKSPFVLVVSSARCLDTPIPHVPAERLCKLDAHMKSIVREQFGAYD
ncbi:hypothetical protein QR680_004589 [Steinernema hermaphroditum]|uniref:TRIP4/RQT4 C2HC5-type zinc finger domain-containing protein n=1 Tax=Steinernema hermaphroditum TaxID=289476 RepID=A0AA39HQ87_9BILA|nr:hypothetical protein QR680_004589 [Steinernema hermaphroditum]